MKKILKRLCPAGRETLRAVTDNKYAHELFPIVRAKDFYPAWYSTIKRSEKVFPDIPESMANKTLTIRECWGVNNLLDKGFILRAWRDISLMVYPDGRVGYAGAGSDHNELYPHNKCQHFGVYEDLTIFKLQNPWMFYGSGTFIQLPCQYHNDLSVRFLQPIGVLEFENQHEANVFLGVKPKDEPYEIFIPAGYPLAHFVKLDQSDVKFKTELVQKLDRNVWPFFLHSHRRYCKFAEASKNKGS